MSKTKLPTIKNCRVESLRLFLENHKVIIDYNSIFILALENFFMFSILDINHIKLPYVSIFNEDFEQNIFRLLSIKYELFTSKMNYISFKRLLMKKGSILVYLDSNCLNKRKKGKINIGICSSVCAYKAKLYRIAINKISLILSDSKNQNVYIPYSIFNYGRFSKIYPSSPNGICYSIFDDGNNNPKYLSPEYCYHHLINVIKKSLVESDAQNQVSSTRDNYNYSLGQNAFSKIEKFFIDIKNNLKKNIYKNENYRRQLLVQLVSIKKAYSFGTLSNYRFELSKALEWLKDNLSSPKEIKNIEMLIQNFILSGEKYQKICHSINSINTILSKDIEEFNNRVEYICDEIINVINYEQSFLKVFLDSL